MFWRCLLPVVQGHYLRSMAQSTWKSGQKMWVPLLGSWVFVIDRLSSRVMTPNIHREMVNEKQQPCSAMAISVSRLKSYEKKCGLNYREVMTLKSSARRNDEKSPFTNLITNYRKILIAIIYARGVCIKPGVPIILEPVLCKYLKHVIHCFIPLNNAHCFTHVGKLNICQ